MKHAVVVLMALLFIVPNVTTATAGAMAQRAAARTLTNQVMRQLEPKIEEIVDNSAIAPHMKNELKRQLNEAADRLVNQQIQSAMGGSLPNPVTIVNAVVSELATISANMAQGGTSGGGGSGAVIVAPNTQQPLPLEQRPFIAVHVSGHSDINVNKFLATDMTRALVRTERYREASRYEEFLAAAENESRTQQLTESRIIELARNYGIQQIGIISMTSILGAYAIIAKIIDTETGETVAETQLDNSLASLADVRVASEGLIGMMSSMAPQIDITPPTITATEQVAQVSATTETPSRAASGRDSDEWKNKNRWVYLGGSMGFGGYSETEKSWPAMEAVDPPWDPWDPCDWGYCRIASSSSDDDKRTGTSFAFAIVADFPVLAPVISLETGLILGSPMIGVPIIGRIGYVSEAFESTFDVGYLIGRMGSIFGGTVGFKVGSGMFFFRYQYYGYDSSDDDYGDSNASTFSAGYKVGVGRVR